MKSYAYKRSHIFSLKLLVLSLYTILTRSHFLMYPYFLLQSYTTVRMVFLQHKIDYAIPCLKLVHLGYTQCMFMEMNFLLQNTFSFCYLDCKLAYNRKYLFVLWITLKSDLRERHSQAMVGRGFMGAQAQWGAL